MPCVGVHVDTKATEFEIAMQISFLMIFPKMQIQQTITASLLSIHLFIYCTFQIYLEKDDYSHHFIFLFQSLNFVEALY